MFKINSNLKIFMLILIASIALFFTKGKYGGFSKNKSIQSCVIAQKKMYKDKHSYKQFKKAVDKLL